MTVPARPSAVGGLLVTGPLGELEAAFVDAVRQNRRRDPFAPLTVLAPSNLLAVHLRRRLAVELGGIAGLRWRTFRDLARDLVGADEPPRAPLPAGSSWLLGRAASRRLPTSPPWSEVRDRPGLGAALAAAARDLRDGGIPFDAAAASNLSALPARHRVPLAALRDGVGPILDRFEDDAALFARAATAAIAEPARLPSEEIFVYGFYDLTASQERLLRAVSSAVPATIFLPVVARGAFDLEDPFGTALLSRLRDGGLPARRLEPGPGTGDLSRLQAALGRGGAVDGGAVGDGSLRVVAAPGAGSEAREVAREVVRMLGDGFAPGEIAVVVHDPTTAPLVAAALERAGIPSRRSAGRPVTECREGVAALALLALARDRESADSPRPGGPPGMPRLPRRDLIRFLSVASRTPGGELDRDELDRRVPAFERAAARAGIVGGVDDWARRTASGRGDDESADLELLGRLVADLAKALSVPAPGSPPEAGPERIVAALRGWIAASPALDRILDAVTPLSGLVRFASEKKLDLPGWDDLLRLAGESIEGATLPDHRFGRGGVEILPLAAMRGLRFRAVVFPGLAHGAFPRGIGADPILPDGLRGTLESLAGGGARLARKGERPREEELLFRLVVEGARERLVLTWPRTDASSRTRYPSRLLVDLARRFGAERLDLLGAGVRRDAPLDGPADGEWPLDRLEVLRPFARRNPAALGAWLQGSGGAASRRLDHWREVVRHPRRWNEWDGIVPPDGEAAEILRRGVPSAPGGEAISSSALETWCTCPRKYFFRHLLGLGAPPDPEEVPELERSDLGSVVHRVLERFVEDCRRERYASLAGVEPDSEAFHERRRRLRAIASEEFLRAEGERAVGLPLVWRQSQAEMLALLDGWLAGQAGEGERGWRWDRTELEFGGDERSRFALDAGGRTFRFRGRIDRVDGDDTGTRIRVTDYKTGERSGKKPPSLDGGRQLQLPIYLAAAAAARDGCDLAASEARYEQLRPSSPPARFGGSGADWFGEERKELATILVTADDGLAGGLFPPAPERTRCARCDFSSICVPKVAEAEAERAGDDPRLEPFRNLSTAGGGEGTPR